MRHSFSKISSAVYLISRRRKPVSHEAGVFFTGLPEKRSDYYSGGSS